jgi:FkbM family methyltransferase
MADIAQFKLMKPIVLLFILIHYVANTFFGIKLRGLGRVQRFLKKPFIIRVFNRKMYFSPVVEGSYDYLLIGKSNEPETHLLLNKVVDGLDRFNFIDVGASVGEFVLLMTNYDSLETCYTFEPRPECAEVIERNNELNNEIRVQVINKAASDQTGQLKIYRNAGGSSSSQYELSSTDTSNFVMIDTVKLDDVLPVSLVNPIILIDIEGAEPLAMRGASQFITTNRPLIIFEYNDTSKKHFKLEEIQILLGDEYSIYRLKHDGTLDSDFSNSWNCVAIPHLTVFEKLLPI